MGPRPWCGNCALEYVVNYMSQLNIGNITIQLAVKFCFALHPGAADSSDRLCCRKSAPAWIFLFSAGAFPRHSLAIGHVEHLLVGFFN